VLPPPPRYPAPGTYNAAIGAGQVAPMIETNNVLTNPSGPEYQFLVGEGEPNSRPSCPSRPSRPSRPRLVRDPQRQF